MEAEAEEEPSGRLGPDQVIDLDEILNGDDDAEDDAEAAELRELGVDPEGVRDEEDEISGNELDNQPVAASKSLKPGMEFNKSLPSEKSALVGSVNAKDDTGLLDEVEGRVNEEDIELPLEDVEIEDGNKAAIDLELEAESRRTVSGFAQICKTRTTPTAYFCFF